MHASAMAQMSRCVDTHLSQGRRYRVVDFGSRISDGPRNSHRDVFAGYDVEYVGVDIDAGRNVDVVMKRPYKIPLRANSVDVVVSGQVFEHIPFFWASFLELARILRPGGLIFSRFRPGDTRMTCTTAGASTLTDCARSPRCRGSNCWRGVPTSLRRRTGAGSTTGESTRPRRTGATPSASSGSRRGTRTWRSGVRTVAVWWANRVGDLSRVPGTDPRHPGRRREPPPAPSRDLVAAAGRVVPRPVRRVIPRPVKRVIRRLRA